MIKAFDILLDTKKEIMNRIHNLNSNDFNVLKFIVTVNENGVPKDLTGATIPRLAVRKPDGKAVFIDGTFTDLTKGKMTFSLGSQAVIASGNHTAEVMVYKGTEEILVTNPFVYHVNKGVLSDESLKSTNEYPAIIKALQAGELLKDYDIEEIREIAEIIDSVDGAGLQYRWDGTKLGIKRESDADFSYVDLRGERGLKGETGARGETGLQGIQGERGITGSTGATGNTGLKGDTGATLYTWIRYATSETGTNISSTPVAATTHIGIATNKTSAAMSNTPGDYTWSNFKGAKGDTGPRGETGLTGIQGIQGIQGERGLTGETGPKGDTGSGLKILGAFSTVGQLPATGEPGDGYMVGENLYIWNGTSYSDAGPIKGQRGETGPAGIAGIAGPIGPTGPKGDTGAAGKDGGIPLNTSLSIVDDELIVTYDDLPSELVTDLKLTGSLLQLKKSDGATLGVGVTLPSGGSGTQGPAGADGKTILNGTATPTTQGTLGDFFLNTATSILYGPKTSSGWGSGVSLKGIKGDTGATGPAGTTSVIESRTSDPASPVAGQIWFRSDL